MEAFPEDYVVHNLPLVLLSGLESEIAYGKDGADSSKLLLSEGGFRIKADIPPVSGTTAQTVLNIFLESDASRSKWNTKAISAKEYAGGFRIRSIGRTYTLPPRKAPPPPHSPRMSPTTEGPPAPLILHSTLSPLTPSSPLFPDGIMTPVWITKHQTRLPSVYISFFSLSADPQTSSLQDNKLKSEIHNVRSVLTSTNYKTKLVVVLLGEDGIAPAELEDRLSTIRRACGLDGKSLFVLPSGSSQVDIVEFVRVLLTSLHPTCVEYYRDLSKHARRKRNRGSIPPPTIVPTGSTSQDLPLQGWNTRYEFKLGVFAEFRQEMDAACRNYESAYESLFAPEVFESTPSWSPRFNASRLLADIIAIRIIRCQLWTEQPTGAVRSWLNHRDRMRDIISRKGNGTDNYSWEAWESTWSKTMAEMISRVELPSLLVRDEHNDRISSLFAGPGKALPMGERITPWEQLHHQGYWLSNATKHVQKRRQLAMRILNEDRAHLGLSPASSTASKPQLHDNHLVLDPSAKLPSSGLGGYNYASDIITTLRSAVEDFNMRGQLRTVEKLQLEEAIEHMTSSAWEQAQDVLAELWKHNSWRTSGWWNFLSRVGWALLECANRSQDREHVLSLTWELSSRLFETRPDHRCDLHGALKEFEVAEVRPSIVISNEEIVSSLVPTFVFGKIEGNVGQPLEAQLCLTSQLQSDAAPLQLSEIKIVFEGSLRPIHLFHDDAISETQKSAQIFPIELQDSTVLSSGSKKRSSAGRIASLYGSANLTMKADDVKIYAFNIVPRESGEVQVASITLIIEDERFSLTLVASHLQDSPSHWWELQRNIAIARPFGKGRDATEVKILPKPPMMRIHTPGLRETYYTNETVQVKLEIHNDEDEAAIATVQARLISPRQHAAAIKWEDEGVIISSNPNSIEHVLILPDRDVGTFGPSSSKPLSIILDDTIDALDHELEIIVKYYLASDPETPLLKISTIDLPFIRPFEANYSFSPRFDSEKWPEFFTPPAIHDLPDSTGLKQKYEVIASIYSFASGCLEIEETALVVHKVVGGAVCQTSNGRRKANPAHTGVTASKDTLDAISPDETQNFCFELEAQKFILGDQQTVGVDLVLNITWRRPGDDKTATSKLEIPRFVAPMAEPRVLLTDAIPIAHSRLLTYQLKFTLENPSMHFLTFNLTLESSEDFAFSGAKLQSLSLVPVSRHTVEYRLLPNKKGVWIDVNLGVVDAYFGKTLKVLPAGDGVMVDKKGNISVWVP